MINVTEQYLWSAVYLMGGLVFIIYFWLKPIIDSKIKYMLMGGQGTLEFAPDGSVVLKVQKTNRNDCVMINGREKPINPNYKQFKFLGIPCHLFVPAVPTNIDLEFTPKEFNKQKKEYLKDQYKIPLDIFEGRINYSGIPDRDIDTHISNMTKDPLREIWLKYKNWIVLILLGILIALGVIAIFIYKDHQILSTCGSVGTTIKNVVTPN